jgi:catechol 2,3-dioxygenase-like lactoylglutathione lyase family enzyme
MIFERINRRHFTRALGTVLVSPIASSFRLSVQSAAPTFTGIDHADFFVSDAEKARDLFARVFGNPVRNGDGRWYIRIGSSYIGFRLSSGTAQARRLEEWSIDVAANDVSKLHTLLSAQGISYQDGSKGQQDGVEDFDNIRTEFSQENGWSLLGARNLKAESITNPGGPLLSAIGIDNILLNTPDLEKSVTFYARFLGEPIRGENQRTWFRVGSSLFGLQLKPQGERTAIHHLGIIVRAFDTDAVSQGLKNIGAVDVRLSRDVSGLGPSRNDPPPKVLIFRDAEGDGFRFQIIERA